MTRLASALGSAYFWADGLQSFSTFVTLVAFKYLYIPFRGSVFSFLVFCVSSYCGVYTYHQFKKNLVGRKYLDVVTRLASALGSANFWADGLQNFLTSAHSCGHVHTYKYHIDLSQRGTRKCAAPKGLSILSLSESAQSEGILPLPGLASFGKYGGRFFSGITTSLILW